MKSKILITCLLAGCMSAASGSSATTALAVLPPFLKVRVERVEVQGVCIAPQSDYFLYITRRGHYYFALITAVDGTPRYEDAPVEAENCGDTPQPWSDTATGFVKASTSPNGREFPQLVVTTRSLQAPQSIINPGQLGAAGADAGVTDTVPKACQIKVDLTLRDAKQCAPPNMGEVD